MKKTLALLLVLSVCLSLLPTSVLAATPMMAAVSETPAAAAAPAEKAETPRGEEARQATPTSSSPRTSVKTVRAASLMAQGDTAAYAAMIGENGYATLQDAIDAAGEGERVTLVKNVTETVTVGADKKLVLDLNGCNITAPTSTKKKYTIFVDGGELTIEGEGVVSTRYGAAVLNAGYWGDEITEYGDVGGGTVTLNGGTYESTAVTSSYVIVNHGALMTINEGVTVIDTGNDTANAAARGVLNGVINVTSQHAQTSEMVINGGTFICIGGQYDRCVHNGYGGTLTINGGAFTAEKGLSLHVAEATDTFATVTGGTFSDDVEEYCAEGYCQNAKSGEVGRHTISTDWTTDETDPDYHWHACENCGEADETTKAEHEWDDGEVTTPATCMEAGVRTFTCDVCGATKTEDIDKLEHTFTGDWLHDGAGHWHVCDAEDCGETDTKAEHAWDDGEMTAAACTQAGEMTYTCTVCGEARTEVIAAAGHNADGVVEHKDATCTEPGVVGGAYCTACGEGKAAAEATIPMTAHNAQGVVEHKDATCAEPGVVGGAYCTACGEGKAAAEAAIPAIAHTVVTDEAVAATCTQPGLTGGSHCSVCDEVLVAQEETEALGHDFAEAWTGDETRHWHVCSRCQTIDGEGEHAWDEGAVTTEATYTAQGVRTFTCTVCEATRTESIPALTQPANGSGSGSTGSGSGSSGGLGGSGGAGSASGLPSGSAGSAGNTENNEIEEIEDPDVPLAGLPTVPDTETSGFVDVPADAWFYEAAQYGVEKGLFNGTSAATFSPDLTTTRGMLATVLYRMEKEPKAAPADFADVPAGQYYTDAVAWAAQAGVVTGYDNGLFGPDDLITREQLAVMLWRYAGHPATDGALDAFTDADQAGDWAAQALRWAVEQGILTGKGNGILDPKGLATRAEVAAMIMRYMEKNSAAD